MATRHREFDQQVVAVALVVRLGAIMVALLGMLSESITPTVLACVLVLSGTSFAYLVSTAVGSFVARHPLAVVADMVLSIAVLVIVGVESPLVLATLSTALVVGVCFRPPVAALGVVVLVAGHLLASMARPGVEHGFMTTLGVPTLYVCLAAIGLVVQAAHAREIDAARELVALHRSVAAADERGRLAREMHDSLGKTLHGIGLAAQALPTWVERDPATAVTYARAIADGADTAAAEARALLVRLRADQPDRPFAQVLADRSRAWQERTGVECAFTSSGAVDLSTDARYEVLAIVDEALENVLRHARATRVEVEMRGCADGAVVVEVRDDGRGCDLGPDGRPRHVREGHFGVRGMFERAQTVGARLELASTAGTGTVVTVRTRPTEEERRVAATT